MRACAGLVPFVVDALRGLAEHCARAWPLAALPARRCPSAARWPDRGRRPRQHACLVRACAPASGPPLKRAARAGVPFAMDRAPAPSSGSAYAAWKARAQRHVWAALASLGMLVEAPGRALAAALARAGALGAAARLAQRYVDAHEPPDRETVAALVTGALRDVLRGAATHVPEVRARAAPAPPAARAGRRRRADAATAARRPPRWSTSRSRQSPRAALHTRER